MNRSVMWAIAFSAAAFVVPVTARNHAQRDARFFDRRIEPILRTHCLGCTTTNWKTAVFPSPTGIAWYREARAVRR